MKKLFALAATGGLILSLAACDWGSKKTDAPALNETATLNESTGNAGAGDNELIVDDNLSTTENATDGNAATVTSNAL